MRALVVAGLVITTIGKDCWKEEEQKHELEVAPFPKCIKQQYDECDQQQRHYDDEWTCCAASDKSIADPTGYFRRACSGNKVTLQEEFNKIPKKNQRETGEGDSRPIIGEWKLPTTGHTAFSIFRKTPVLDASYPYDKQLYADYIGDYLYYHVLVHMIGDPLMLHFHNEIEQNNENINHVEWDYYYREWLTPLEPYHIPDALFTVANVQESTLIFFMDVLLMTPDRYALSDMEAHIADIGYDAQFVWNPGNIMQHQFHLKGHKHDYWRIIPIDNDIMRPYIANYLKGQHDMKEILDRWIEFIKKLVENTGTEKYNLWNLCQDFVTYNHREFFPASADVQLLQKIVYNTVYNYGKTIGENIERTMNEWTHRAKDNDIFDGEEHFYWYLQQIIPILKKMPGNIVTNNEQERAIGKNAKIHIGLMQNVLIADLVKDAVYPKLQWSAMESPQNYYNQHHHHNHHRHRQHRKDMDKLIEYEEIMDLLRDIRKHNT